MTPGLLCTKYGHIFVVLSDLQYRTGLGLSAQTKGANCRHHTPILFTREPLFFSTFFAYGTLCIWKVFWWFDVLSNEDTIMNSRFLLTFWLSSIYTAHKVQKDFWRVRVLHWTYNSLKFWWFNTISTLLWTLMANSKYTFLQLIKIYLFEFCIKWGFISQSL